MDKAGLVNLPPGFRFHPTDEELVVDYLKPKSCCCPLPASIIPDFDACTADPWDLPGEMGQEMRYFFSNREAKYPNGNRSNRATSSGYWKATGLDKKIVASTTSNINQLVGIKKTLVFYRGKPPNGTRTDWIMHEYRLANNVTSSKFMVPLENWVLCRVFLKKRGTVCLEFVKGRTDLNVVPSSACSGSSGITEIYSKGSADRDREENSSCNSFPCLQRK